jgi:hypothetical protein
VAVPECGVLGLAYGELLRGKSCRAESVHLYQPSFEALVNHDKPAKPFVKRPLMVHEALAAIPFPLQIGLLHLINGHLAYAERVVAGAAPGVLTFSAVSISVAGIANRAEPPATIFLLAQGDLMEAATLRVLMSIPVAPPNFSLRYSGSLGAMDLTRLDAFLDIAEHTRIKSGYTQEAAFEIDVTDGQAQGRVQGTYRNLQIAILNKQTDSSKGLRNRMESFLANEFRIRRANAPGTLRETKEGKVNYSRRPQDKLMQFVWFALRNGILDLISE